MTLGGFVEKLICKHFENTDTSENLILIKVIFVCKVVDRIYKSMLCLYHNLILIEY